jgi:hypothetical protein
MVIRLALSGLGICCREGSLLFACLEGVPASWTWKGLLLGICETSGWLVESLTRLPEARRHWRRRRGSVGAILVELVVIAPVITVICVLLGLDPFLSLHAVNISLEVRRLASREEGLLLTVPGVMSVLSRTG